MGANRNAVIAAKTDILLASRPSFTSFGEDDRSKGLKGVRRLDAFERHNTGTRHMELFRNILEIQINRAKLSSKICPLFQPYGHCKQMRAFNRKSLSRSCHSTCMHLLPPLPLRWHVESSRKFFAGRFVAFLQGPQLGIEWLIQDHSGSKSVLHSSVSTSSTATWCIESILVEVLLESG